MPQFRIPPGAIIDFEGACTYNGMRGYGIAGHIPDEEAIRLGLMKPEEKKKPKRRLKASYQQSASVRKRVRTKPKVESEPEIEYKPIPVSEIIPQKQYEYAVDRLEREFAANR